VFLSLCSGAVAAHAADRGQMAASEVTRYPDPATDFEVSRLTDPAVANWLPPVSGRPISRNGNSLVYASARSGSLQAWRLDVKSGQSRQITQADALVPTSLSLMGDEKSVCYVAGNAVWQTSMSSLKSHEVYRVPEGFRTEAEPRPSGSVTSPGVGFATTDDGLHAVLVESSRTASRLRLIDLRTGAATTTAESFEAISDPLPRPRRAGILYHRAGRELWVVNFDGQQNRRLRLAPGVIGPAAWSRDGRTAFYLNYPDEPRQLYKLREVTPDTNEDRQLAATTQYVSFGSNADSSVFVGASGSKASPYVLLLVRSVRRELTLCEHRASDPRLVSPQFSPNSQRVFFQSDRHGKMAIYSMRVEKLVEETEAS
jgi:oligogalacturonide lyase